MSLRHRDQSTVTVEIASIAIQLIQCRFLLNRDGYDAAKRNIFSIPICHTATERFAL
jgi:hypothetical protein